MKWFISLLASILVLEILQGENLEIIHKVLVVAVIFCIALAVHVVQRLGTPSKANKKK